MPSDRERVADDPDLLADARRRYRGSGDLRDHLWWLDHPGEPTPEGVEDPAIAIERQARERFRPGGALVDPERLREQEEQLASDRAAADAAVGETVAAIPVSGGARAARRSRRPSVGAVVAMVVIALLVGGGAGAVAVRAQLAAAQRAPALAVFDREQRAADRPTTDDLDLLLDRSSTRLLRSYSAIGLVAYGVRTPTGGLCLLVVVLGTQPTASCTNPAGFAQAGLTWIGTASADPVDDGGTRPVAQLRLVWMPAGTISITPVDSP